MTSKFQKSLIGLSEQDRMIVKSLRKEREERTRADIEHLVKYFTKINVFRKHGIDGGDLEKVI